MIAGSKNIAQKPPKWSKIASSSKATYTSMVAYSAVAMQVNHAYNKVLSEYVVIVAPVKVLLS